MPVNHYSKWLSCRFEQGRYSWRLDSVSQIVKIFLETWLSSITWRHDCVLSLGDMTVFYHLETWLCSITDGWYTWRHDCVLSLGDMTVFYHRWMIHLETLLCSITWRHTWKHDCVLSLGDKTVFYHLETWLCSITWRQDCVLSQMKDTPGDMTVFYHRGKILVDTWLRSIINGDDTPVDVIVFCHLCGEEN